MSTTFPAPGSVSPVDPDQFRALLRANQVPAPGQAVVASELDRTIADCGRLPAVVSSSTAVGAPTARAVDADGIAYELVEQRRQLVNDVVEHSFFQDIAADVWPGAVLQGIHLTKGDTAPIPLPRAAGTVGIVTDLVSTNPGTQSRVVEQPSQTTVGDTRRSLLEALRPQDSAGLLKTDYQEARTLREVSARLGVDLSGAGWGAEVDASLSQSYRSSTVIASIRQIYYSAVFEPNGGGAAGFLTPEVGVDQLGPFMGPGNPPLYVSTVHYGRALVITATAATSSMALSAALKAHWQAAVSAEVELDAQSRTLIESSHVRVYTIGRSGPRYLAPSPTPSATWTRSTATGCGYRSPTPARQSPSPAGTSPTGPSPMWGWSPSTSSP